MCQLKLYFLILYVLSIAKMDGQIAVAKEGGNWGLFVAGEPYEIKGVTFGYDSDIAKYEDYCKELSFLGVNTIRTWATGENTMALLDAAHKHGIRVMLGIWMRHGRPGMEDDDRFDYLKDAKGKEEMFRNALKVVNMYKDHPAVLMWGVGNEVYLNTAKDEEKVVYSQLLERVCSAIKKEDVKHPIVSVEAWTFGMDWWQKYVPSLDVYGLNSYGPGANLLAEELQKRGIDKPYIITEFGVTGEWDVNQQKNGVIVAPNDAQKYEAIAKGYPNWIRNKSANLGVFVFHYASGTDFMAPWLFTHYNGMKRPQYWAIREAFTGEQAINKVPEIKRFLLSANALESNVWVPVHLEVKDVEEDSLTISFAYNQRTGSRKRRDQLIVLEHRWNAEAGYEIKLPEVDGPVKVYALVEDSYGNMGIESTGIVVNDEEAKKIKYLVPKVALPFYVYKDGENEPYAASAYMGNYKAMKVVTRCEEDVYSGTAALKIAYNQDHNWYGLGLVDPANDWGDVLGGYDISGAKKFSFWAKASKKDVKVSIGFGLIGKNKPFPDTAKKAIEIKLTTKWKKYTIKTKKLDLSCIRSGLTFFSSSYGSGQDVFIDEVVFE